MTIKPGPTTTDSGQRRERTGGNGETDTRDRVINAAGYYPWNITILCLACNGAKGDHSLAELADGCDRHRTCAARRHDMRDWARGLMALQAA